MGEEENALWLRTEGDKGSNDLLSFEGAIRDAFNGVRSRLLDVRDGQLLHWL